jgi:hypothetical protein
MEKTLTRENEKKLQMIRSDTLLFPAKPVNMGLK